MFFLLFGSLSGFSLQYVTYECYISSIQGQIYARRLLAGHLAQKYYHGYTKSHRQKDSTLSEASQLASMLYIR